MTIRRILLVSPLLLLVFLLQSYFWVPGYDQQTRGNPDRLKEYVEASIGDASILNPILSADSASSDINSKVFEGLIDRDEELRFRGRVATSWDIFEEAYFYVNEGACLHARTGGGAREVVRLIEQAGKEGPSLTPELRAALDNIREISIIPAKESLVPWPPGAQPGGQKPALKIKVKAPERIKLLLHRVDQDLFRNLVPILGEDYFETFSPERYLTVLEGKEQDLTPEVAAGLLPATEHNPVILFHLRPNVKFHDGHVLDANDVKFTYEAIMNPRNLSPRLADYEPVKGVEVLGPLTLRIVYKRLYSPALETWAMGILPEHLLNDKALRAEAIRRAKDPETFTMRQSRFNRHPVGCGPYVFHRWKSDQYILLERFEDYWEGPPNYLKYAYRIIPDRLTQEMEFYAGTIDSYDVQPHQVKRLKGDPRYQSFSGLSLGYTYIGYNLRRKPFDDPRVRTALGMAIDVDKIIKYVLHGQGERITGPFVKQTDYYNHRIRPLPYDPRDALELLEQAGWRRNRQGWLEKAGQRFQFTLITNSGNDIRKAILAIAQDSWRQIGVDVKTDLLEWSVFIQERVDKADFDALILGWLMGIEPDLFQIWHSSQTNPYQLNFVGFKNLEADDLIIKIRQEYDHEKRVEYCHRLHEIIAREQPYTFLYVGRWTAVLDKRIVIRDLVNGRVVYRQIRPTKTGSYTYHFNKWIKLSKMPQFAAEG